MSFLISIFIYLIFFQGIKLNFIDSRLFSFIDELFIIFLCALLFINILIRKKLYKEQFILIILTIIFAGIGAVSYGLNSYGSSNLKDLIMSTFLACKFWLVIICFSVIDFKFDIKKKIKKIIFFIEKIAIILGSINIIFPNLYLQFFTFPERYTRFGFESITSCFNHPSTFGWFMMICAFLHFASYIQEQKQGEKTKTIISILFALLSFRTKIIISVAVFYFVYEFIIQSKDIRKYLKKIIFGFIIVLILGFTFKNVLTNTYTLYFKSEQGVTARSALSTTGNKIMKDYFPLGVGFGKYGTWYASKNYSEYYYKYGINDIYGLRIDDSRYSTDTFWPAIMGETGFLGLILYIGMIFYILRILLKFNKVKGDNKEEVEYLICSILMLSLLLVESAGEASFNFSPKNIIVGMFVGISIKDYLKQKRQINMANNQKNNIKYNF